MLSILSNLTVSQMKSDLKTESFRFGEVEKDKKFPVGNTNSIVDLFWIAISSNFADTETIVIPCQSAISILHNSEKIVSKIVIFQKFAWFYYHNWMSEIFAVHQQFSKIMKSRSRRLKTSLRSFFDSPQCSERHELLNERTWWRNSLLRVVFCKLKLEFKHLKMWFF